MPYWSGRPVKIRALQRANGNFINRHHTGQPYDVLDQTHLAEKLTGPEPRQSHRGFRLTSFDHLHLARGNKKHPVARLALAHDDRPGGVLLFLRQGGKKTEFLIIKALHHGDALEKSFRLDSHKE